MQRNIQELLAAIQAGDHKSIAKGITLVENALPGAGALLEALPHTGSLKVVGITGPPGAGKSTLVNALLKHWVKQDKKIAVLAVDPSSPFNFGALLGDRIRMSEFYNHPNVYIRSLATRGALGGLHPTIIEITDLLKTAPFDYIIVETVGVGQSEVDIAGLADCTIVALVPEAGDVVQTLKAGIMEIADLFVVNKADREGADTLYRNLRILAHEKATEAGETPVIKTVATSNEGIEELATAIDNWLQTHNKLPERRVHLLAEKSWQLLQAARMKDLNFREIKDKLGKALEAGDFNLYTFTRQYL